MNGKTRLRLVPAPPAPARPAGSHLDVAELRRLHSEATDGGTEWDPDVLLAERLGSLAEGVPWLEADVRLVAAAVNALPRLLDAYEALDRIVHPQGRAGGDA